MTTMTQSVCFLDNTRNDDVVRECEIYNLETISRIRTLFFPLISQYEHHVSARRTREQAAWWIQSVIHPILHTINQADRRALHNPNVSAEAKEHATAVCLSPSFFALSLLNSQHATDG
jgi:hypothetical protein